MYQLSLLPSLRQSAAVAAITLGLSLPVLAQTEDNATLPSRTSERVELSADRLTYDAATGEVRALGQVVLRREGFTLLAGEIRYNEKTGKAEAVGAVELRTPNGERIFSPKLELNEQLKTAFVEDFRLLLTDGSKAAAESGDYDEEAGKSTLNRAVYSPCEVCEGDPNAEPIWQIKAVRVTHDREKKRLYYKNAFLEVLGVPIFWTPYFSHPDPTVDKASGFLPFDFKRRNELGLVASAPYYLVLSDSRDLTITPTITTLEGPVLAAEYRSHLGFGQYELDGSITYTDRLDFVPLPDGTPDFIDTGEEEFRGHIAARGTFQHSKNWRSNFDLAWASDDTYLRRYDFSNLDTLISEYELEGFFGRSYVSARTIGFQGLRAEDVTGLTGHALPLINAEYVSNFKPLGGTIKVRGNAASIVRTNGLDTQRLSASANWERRLVTPKGVVIDTEALVRADYYNISDIDRPDDPAFGSTVEEAERLLARATARFAWPLVKTSKTGTHTIEPLVEITVSPKSGSIDGLVNEDSRAFELNELNLFGAERAPGFDLWEEGTRVTYGLNWRFDGKMFSTDVLFGQSARITGDANQFPVGTGLEGDFSDFVGHTRIRYGEWLDLEHRYRLSDDNLNFRRNEIAIRFGKEAWGFSTNYLFLDRDLGQFTNEFINREDREEIQVTGFVKLDEKWTLSGLTIQNLTEGRDTIQYGGTLSYRDECLEFAIEVRENFTIDRDFNPGTSVLFRVKLRNLG